MGPDGCKIHLYDVVSSGCVGMNFVVSGRFTIKSTAAGRQCDEGGGGNFDIIFHLFS